MKLKTGYRRKRGPWRGIEGRVWIRVEGDWIVDAAYHHPNGTITVWAAAWGTQGPFVR